VGHLRRQHQRLPRDGRGHPNWRFLIPIGFIGAYTTFSTFEFETFRAVTDGAWLVGGLNVVGSVVAGYVALWLGVVLTRLV
jgi:CrcB protein